MVGFKDWDAFGPEHYSLYEAYANPGVPIGIHFRCPGCSAVIAIETGEPGEHPKWAIDFATLTATPSILHTKDDVHDGCGWHGYLTNGELKPC